MTLDRIEATPGTARSDQRASRILDIAALLRFATVCAMSLCLACCGRTEAYRYKLALAVDTPEGVKRAASVVEVMFYEISFPENGTMHKLRGEALYLDLGPGARPLIALLTNQLHPKYGKELRWTRDAGPETRWFSRIHDQAPSEDFMDDLPRIAHARGPRKITPADLPDLVTFADINDPKSVIEVDPGNLQGTLGASISWNEITLESTEEPITTGLRTKLPWLPAYFQSNLRLDGSDHEAKNELANILSSFDFDQSATLKR